MFHVSYYPTQNHRRHPHDLVHSSPFHISASPHHQSHLSYLHRLLVHLLIIIVITSFLIL